MQADRAPGRWDCVGEETIIAALFTNPDGRQRCGWSGDDPAYMAYHDQEWGRPVDDDRRLFEKLCLEGFQAGLSWLTILRKRDNFRAAFADFDPQRVARFGSRDVARLLEDVGIVRHRGKIEAAINNAARTLEVIEEWGSLGALLWSFAPPPQGGRKGAAGVPVTTPEARSMTRDLRRRGFRFIGPTTAYAFMQAMGMVNDHLDGCWARAEVAAEHRAFRRPRRGGGAL